MPLGRQLVKVTAAISTIMMNNLLFIYYLLAFRFFLAIQLLHIEEQYHDHAAGNTAVSEIKYRTEEKHFSCAVVN